MRTPQSWVVLSSLSALLVAVAGCTGGFVLSDLLRIDRDPTPIRPGDASQIANVAPVASAGNDQTVTAGDDVILNATGSTDPDADHLLFSWTQIAGEPVELEAPGSSIASFVAPSNVTSPITLTFRVYVVDGTVSRTDDVSITVLP